MISNQNSARPRFKWFPGLWIVLAIGVLFGGRIYWRQLHYPHQIKQLAADFSSISIIQTRPVLNHAETLVGVIHTTEHGVGVFVADTKTRTENELCEVKDYKYVAPGTTLFGWSPDDETFAFSWDGMLRFWTRDGASALDEIPLSNGANLFAWLSPESCVLIDKASTLRRFGFLEGHWQQTDSWPLESSDGMPRSLLAISSNSVAWHTSKAIWQMALDNAQPKRLYSSKGDIGSISYAEETGEFLLVVNTNKSKISSLHALSQSTLQERPLAADRYFIREAQWINKGHGYACRGVNGDATQVIAKMDGQSAEMVFFRHGDAQSLLLGGGGASFYVFSAQTNEPPGVWKCDALKGETAYIFSPLGDRHRELHYNPALTGYAPYANHNARYTLVPPSNYSRHKKYPLIIGLSGYQWTPIAYATYAQCLAQSGAFVAFTGLTFGAADEARLDRFHAHTNNVLAIYDQLTANPSVDRDRVYLFAFSQSTLILNDLVKDYPGLWRGVILLNPGGGPQNLPQDSRLKTVVATAGMVESESQRFVDYQSTLWKMGVPMRWHTESDSAHFERAQSTLRERTLLMADAVFDGHIANLTNAPATQTRFEAVNRLGNDGQ
jgi:hypothetical protein